MLDVSNTETFRKCFKLAKSNCCNYSASGPITKSHYCLLEPTECYLATNYVKHQCYFAHGSVCQWFVDAVLPSDKVLQTEWQNLIAKLMQDKNKPVEYSKKKVWWTICGCGKEFQASANGQKRCPNCAKKRTRQLRSERKRKQKGRNGALIDSVVQ